MAPDDGRERTIGRRELLRALFAAGALAGLGRRALALTLADAASRVSLGILLTPGSPEGQGALLGLEEARRLGDLLHVAVVSEPGSRFVRIGEAPRRDGSPILFLATSKAAGAPAWNVTSSPSFRRQALARFPQRRDLRVVDWHPALMKFGAEALNVRYLRRFGHAMDERAWHGWMAVKCAVELALRYPGGSPRQRLGELRLDGHKGMMLRFDPGDRHLVQPVYLTDAAGRLAGAVEPEWTR